MKLLVGGVIAAALLGLFSFATAEEPAKEARAEAPQPGAQLFARCDLNKDGKIDWEEFQKVKSGFARLDADGDGFITQEEARKHVARRQQQVQKMMRRHMMRSMRQGQGPWGDPGMGRGRWGPPQGRGQGFGPGPGQGPRWQRGGRGMWWGGPQEDAPRPPAPRR